MSTQISQHFVSPFFLWWNLFLATIFLHSLFFIGFLVLDSAPEFTKIITFFFYLQCHHKSWQKKPEIFSSKPVMSKKISDCLLLKFELVFPVRYNFSSSDSIWPAFHHHLISHLPFTCFTQSKSSQNPAHHWKSVSLFSSNP